MIFEIFMIIFVVVVGCALFVFGHKVMKSMRTGFNNLFSMVFMLCLSDQLSALKKQGWKGESYSGIGGNKPTVHLKKGRRMATLTLDAETGGVTLTMEDETVALDDKDSLEKTIHGLERKTYKLTIFDDVRMVEEFLGENA